MSPGGGLGPRAQKKKLVALFSNFLLKKKDLSPPYFVAWAPPKSCIINPIHKIIKKKMQIQKNVNPVVQMEKWMKKKEKKSWEAR